MSDTENTPVLPGNEDKPAPPAPVVKPEEKPTGNGETESVDEDVKPKEESKPAEKKDPKPVEKEESKPVEKEESKNGAEESKGAPMEVEQPAKEVVSTPVKGTPTKKEETDGHDAEEDQESSSEEEPPLGLLERPVEVSGKRERKKTERLSMSGTFTPTDKKLEVPEGSGTKLGDIPRVEHFISKTSSDDCKILHRTIYGRPGTVSMVKRNLRKFCGFTFSEDSPEFNKKKSNLAKLPVTEIKRVAGLLDQDRSGSREEIAERCMRFLLNPKDSGKPVPQKKARTKGGAKKGTKRKRKGKKGEGEGDDVGDDDDDDDDDDADDDDDDVSGDSNKAESGEDEEAEKSEELSEDDDGSDVEKPKKKKPRLESPKKKKPTKTATAKPKKEKKEKKEKPKKEKKKAAPKKKKAASSGDESSDEDEPLSKKSKKGPPTNDEIRDLVKSILEGANLEEVTMKTVCKQVYLKFPDYDLTDRKDFIKSTVKQLIS